MKTVELKYSGKTDEVKDKETGAIITPSVAFDGVVMANLPETLEEAKLKYGEAICLSKVIQAVKIDMQRICRVYEGDNDKAQAAIDQFVPGISRERAEGGMSMKAVKEKLKGLTPAELDALLEDLRKRAGEAA